MVTSDLWYLWKDPNWIHFSNRNLKRSETVHSFGAAALALALRLTPQEVTFQFGSQKEAPAAHPKSMFWFSTKLSMIVLGASDSFEDFHCNQQPINSQKPVPFLCLVQLMGGKKIWATGDRLKMIMMPKTTNSANWHWSPYNPMGSAEEITWDN